jgi:hypothetical protein
MAINRPNVNQVSIHSIKLFVKVSAYALSNFKYTFARLKNVNTNITSY